MKSTKELARELGLLRKRSSSSAEQSLKRIKKTNQLFSYLIVIDFESTCWQEDRHRPQEIIEFPAVLLNTNNGEIEDVFHYYVQPQEYPTLSSFCTELTGISQEQVDQGIPISNCLHRFNSWLRRMSSEKQLVITSRVEGNMKACTFVTWSDWDLGVCLQYECRRKQLRKPPELNSWIDLRATYRKFYARKPNGLNGALTEVGIEFAGRQHSGVDDAKNTAHLAWRMMCDGCVLQITKSVQGPGLAKAPLIRQVTSVPDSKPDSTSSAYPDKTKEVAPESDMEVLVHGDGSAVSTCSVAKGSPSVHSYSNCQSQTFSTAANRFSIVAAAQTTTTTTASCFRLRSPTVYPDPACVPASSKSDAAAQLLKKVTGYTVASEKLPLHIASITTCHPNSHLMQNVITSSVTMIPALPGVSKMASKAPVSCSNISAIGTSLSSISSVSTNGTASSISCTTAVRTISSSCVSKINPALSIYVSCVSPDGTSLPSVSAVGASSSSVASSLSSVSTALSPSVSSISSIGTGLTRNIKPPSLLHGTSQLMVSSADSGEGEKATGKNFTKLCPESCSVDGVVIDDTLKTNEKIDGYLEKRNSAHCISTPQISRSASCLSTSSLHRTTIQAVATRSFTTASARQPCVGNSLNNPVTCSKVSVMPNTLSRPTSIPCIKRNPNVSTTPMRENIDSDNNASSINNWVPFNTISAKPWKSDETVSPGNRMKLPSAQTARWSDNKLNDFSNTHDNDHKLPVQTSVNSKSNDSPASGYVSNGNTNTVLRDLGVERKPRQSHGSVCKSTSTASSSITPLSANNPLKNNVVFTGTSSIVTTPQSLNTKAMESTCQDSPGGCTALINTSHAQNCSIVTKCKSQSNKVIQSPIQAHFTVYEDKEMNPASDQNLPEFRMNHRDRQVNKTPEVSCQVTKGKENPSVFKVPTPGPSIIPKKVFSNMTNMRTPDGNPKSQQQNKIQTPSPGQRNGSYKLTTPVNCTSYSVHSTMKRTPPMCECGRRSTRKIVQTPGPNQGRAFLCCPIGQRGSGMKKGCKFFKWEENQNSPNGISPSFIGRSGNCTGNNRKTWSTFKSPLQQPNFNTPLTGSKIPLKKSLGGKQCIVLKSPF